MSSAIVLDAWTVLAFLQREGPAALIVRRLLRRAIRGNIRLFDTPADSSDGPRSQEIDVELDTTELLVTLGFKPPSP